MTTKKISAETLLQRIHVPSTHIPLPLTCMLDFGSWVSTRWRICLNTRNWYPAKGQTTHDEPASYRRSKKAPVDLTNPWTCDTRQSRLWPWLPANSSRRRIMNLLIGVSGSGGVDPYNNPYIFPKDTPILVPIFTSGLPLKV